MTQFSAAHWRARAEEARTQAEEMNDETARKTMLEIAEAYERMAKREEELTAKMKARSS